MESKNDTGNVGSDAVRKPVDLAGMIFKVTLLALVLGVGYFLVKPVWDDLFQSLPNTPIPQTRGELFSPEMSDES